MLDPIKLNKDLWNKWACLHLDSGFYDIEGFKAGKSSLIGPEVGLLGDVKGKSLLHLQCHFGQDTLSLARLGADATGVDLADKAIEIAEQLSSELGLKTRFICSDILLLKDVLHEKFDIVYTSYGVLVWLQKLDQWADIIQHFLKRNGRLILVEFHPFLNTLNETLDGIEYSYFNNGAVIEKESGSYASPGSKSVKGVSATWDHSLDEVFNALWNAGLDITGFREYDYSPYNIVENSVPSKLGYQIKGLEGRIPMLYSITAKKPTF